MSPGSRPTAEEPNVLQSIFRHRLLILVCAAVSTGVGFVVHDARPAMYGAQANVLLQEPQASFASDARPQALRDEDRYVADQVALIKSSAVLDRASELIRARWHGSALSTQQIAQAMSVSAIEISNFVTIRFQAHSPDLARTGANSIAVAYRRTARLELAASIAAARRSLDVQIAQVTEALAAAARAKKTTAAPAKSGHSRTTKETASAAPKQSSQTQWSDAANTALLSALQDRRNQLDVDARVAGNGVALLESAGRATRQGASLRATLAVALVLGLLLGTGLAYGREALKLRALRRRRPLDAPPLAEIPDLGRQNGASTLLALDTPDSHETSVQVRRAHARLGFALLAAIVAGTRRRSSVPTEASVQVGAGGRAKGATKGTRFRPVAYVSATPGEGATTVAANTALAAARAGGHVLLVDGDVRESGLSRLIDTHPRLHAGESLADADGNGTSHLVPAARTTLERLELPFGAGSVTLVRPGPDILAALAELRRGGRVPGLDLSPDDFDVVYLDVPPLLESPWASQLLRLAEGVVLVVSDRAEIGALDRALAHLDSLEIEIHGYVRNFTAAEEAAVSPLGLTELVRAVRSRAAGRARYGRRLRPHVPFPRKAESEEARVPVPADATGVGVGHD